MHHPGTPGREPYLPNVRDIISEGYGYQFTSSIIFALMILDVVLLVRIKYGDAVITHLTTRPYKVAFYLLVSM